MPAALFGKLPRHGDFVARNLPPGLRPRLDRWLTAHLAARARAPESWPAGGLRAALDLGGQSLTALILPSTDRAGRAFPLAACRLPGLSHAEAQRWCDAALRPALAATAGDLGADALLDALSELPAEGEGPAPPGIWTGAHPEPVAATDAASFARLMGAVSSG